MVAFRKLKIHGTFSLWAKRIEGKSQVVVALMLLEILGLD
jgi:hypothetical protein